MSRGGGCCITSDSSPHLAQARLVRGPSLTLPAQAVDALSLNQSRSRRGSQHSHHSTASSDASAPAPAAQHHTQSRSPGPPFKAVPVVLTYEVDGKLLPRQQVVELRWASARLRVYSCQRLCHHNFKPRLAHLLYVIL